MMDSSDGHSDVSDGSGSGPETKVTIKTDKSRDKGPKWACSKATFQEWLWETEPAWDAMGLQKTYTGRNRADSESFDKAVRERYAKSNRERFRAIISDSWKGTPHPGESNENDDQRRVRG